MDIKIISQKILKDRKNMLKYESARNIWDYITINGPIFWGWGVDLDSIKETENSLSFHVQGFLHTGTVKVEYNVGKDLFDVSFINEDGSLKEKINDVYCDMLAETIDKTVETSDNQDEYFNKVKEEYKL